MVFKTPKIDENEVKEIIEKYYRKRFKEKVSSTGQEKTEETKTDQDVKDAVKTNEETPTRLSKSVDSQTIAEPEHHIFDKKAHKLFVKRKSQVTSDSQAVLEKQETVKRHASDDDKKLND